YMEPLGAVVWFVVVLYGLTAIIATVFCIIMIVNFTKRRTGGTALLGWVYGCVAVFQINSIVYNIYGKVDPLSTGHAISLLIYISSLVLVFYFLYVFASRHIINDTDVMRSIYSIIILGLPGIIIGVLGYEMLKNIQNPIFVQITTESGTELLQFQPTLLISLILYAIMLIMVQTRIIIGLTVNLVKHKTKDPVRRKGLQFILIAVIFLFITVFLTVVFTIEGIGPVLVIIVYILKSAAFTISIILSYIGWILPERFRVRVRNRWIKTQVGNDR
ncbi:MAG: hypothetical protein ACTSQ0_10340, partial [Candidatus Heimdallarchaeota archaeon]